MEKNKEKIATHGRVFKGIVISDKMQKTATVEWSRRKKVPKFERYEKARTKVKAHNTIGAKMGDLVKVYECRPLSKTKHFVITEIISKSEEVNK